MINDKNIFFVKLSLNLGLSKTNLNFEYSSNLKLGTQNAMTRCCYILMLFLACPVVYLKTEIKPFTQNAYLLHFLKGHLSLLHSCLTQESPKPCKINVSSTLKKNMQLLD